ncbi:MAG: electron transfer flavoprotein subunit beta/FixA family protein [Bacteroidota bacterium]|nr:electron transfer flavoprotein subunit beta/FixA family protein [Bacteroidota bacterium]
MKILVCISNVPDTTTKVTFTEGNTQFNNAGVQYIINPYDELALTRALELTEAQGGTVTVVNVGLAETETNIRKALAIGATDAIRINAMPVDAYYVAEQIAEVVKNGDYDLVITGRESIDYNGGQMCGLLAEMLEWPGINVVTKIDIEDGKATCERDIDGGKEKVRCALPCVVSAQKELTEPRIPNMRGIMAARTKPLQVLEPIQNQIHTKVSEYEMPPAKSICKMIDPADAGQLIALLHTEAKVI